MIEERSPSQRPRCRSLTGVRVLATGSYVPVFLAAASAYLIAFGVIHLLAKVDASQPRIVERRLQTARARQPGGRGTGSSLTFNPAAGNVAKNHTDIVDVTFDAAQVTQPGDYYAHLKIKEDTPYTTSDVQVHMVAFDRAFAYPMAWSKSEGRGRVAHLAPGHSAQVWSLEPYQRLLLQTLDWLVERN